MADISTPADLKRAVSALKLEKLTDIEGHLGKISSQFSELAKISSTSSQAISKEVAAKKELNTQTDQTSLKIKAFIAGLGGYFTIQGAKGFAGASSPNGLDSVDKAFGILAGTIGSVLLPGFDVLGGVALMAADRLQAWIDKNLDGIIDAWVDVIEGATGAMEEFVKWLEKPVENSANWALDRLKEVDDALGFRQGIGTPQAGVQPFSGLFGGEGLNQGPNLDNLPNTKGPSLFEQIMGKSLTQRIKDTDKAADLRELAGNMRMINRDRQMSILRPSLTDPVGKWKETALQIQNSELEMRRMEMQQKAIDASDKLSDRLDRLADKLDPPGQQQGGAFIGGRLRIGR